MVAGGLDVPVQMSLLLAVSLLGYLVAQRLGQSVVVGEILVGVVVGPSVLGLVEVVPGGLVEALAYVGAIVLLFVVGLETDFRDILRPSSVPIAIFGVVVPWLGGFGLARAFGQTTTEAVFVGTALTATSIAITANVLREYGLLDSRVAKTILAAAILDDVLGLLMLGMTVQATQEGALSLASGAVLAAKAVGFFVGALLLGRLAIDPFLDRLYAKPAKRVHPEFVFMAALTVAFVYSAAAEAVGLSGIIGAFLAGLSLDEPHEHHGRSYREGAEYLQIVFAGIFFVSLGVLVDLRGADLSIAGYVVALTVVAVLTKLVGCAVPARLAGFPTREAVAVGVGMVPRGEVAMVVGLLGLSAGVIGQDTYGAVVLMALFTTVLTPPFLERLLKK